MIIILFISIIFLIVTLLSERSLLKPGVIFLCVWIVVLTMYQFRVIELNDISQRTICILGIGLSAFSISALNNRRIHGWSSEKRLHLEINTTVVFIFACITVITYLPETFNSAKMLLSGNTFQMIRAASGMGETVVQNYFILLLRTFIIRPFIFVLYPINAIVFLEKKTDRLRIPLFVITLIVAIMMVIYEGGRSPIVYFVLHFILVAILLKKKIQIPSYLKKWIILLIAIAILAFAYISASRGIENLKQSIYMYFCGGIPLLDAKTADFDLSGVRAYGMASLSIPIDFIFTLLGPLGIGRPDSFMHILDILLSVEETIPIGVNIRMNAFVTMFYYLYLDGGYVGVLIGSLLYGFISSICYNNYLAWKDSKSLTIYCLILQGIIFSFIRLQFVASAYFFAFVVLQFLFKRSNYEDFSNNSVESD